MLQCLLKSLNANPKHQRVSFCRVILRFFVTSILAYNFYNHWIMYHNDNILLYFIVVVVLSNNLIYSNMQTTFKWTCCRVRIEPSGKSGRHILPSNEWRLQQPVLEKRLQLARAAMLKVGKPGLLTPGSWNIDSLSNVITVLVPAW